MPAPFRTVFDRNRRSTPSRLAVRAGSPDEEKRHSVAADTPGAPDAWVIQVCALTGIQMFATSGTLRNLPPVESGALVSVIIVVSGDGAHLEEAIESVVRQSCDRWELCLIGCETSEEVRETGARWASRYQGRIRCVPRPAEAAGGGGMEGAHLAALRQARGAYVAFLEPEDLWHADKLEQQIAILEAHPEAAMVYGRTLIWHSWTGREIDRPRDYTCELGIEPDVVVDPPRLIPLLLGNQFATASISDALLRREPLTEVSETLGKICSHCDAAMLLAGAMLSWPVFVAGNCWTRIRYVTVGASSTTEHVEDPAARVTRLRCLERVIRATDVRDETVASALQGELINYSFDDVAGAIRDRFPDLEIEQVGFLGEGFDSRAYRINQKYIFRFPKHAAARRALSLEVPLLWRLGRCVSLPVPQPKYVSSATRVQPVMGRVRDLVSGARTRWLGRPALPEAPWVGKGATFVGYEELPGGLLYPGVLLKLPAGTRNELATQIGEFLKELHAFPADVAKRLGARERSFHARYYRRAGRLLHGHVLPHASEQERRILLDLFEGTSERARLVGYRPALLHGDLNWSHLLFDATRERIAGIIDFGGMFIGDPAYDLIELWRRYDEDFVRLIIEKYGVPDPARYLDRVRLIYACERLHEIRPGERRDPGTLAEVAATLVKELQR